MRAADELIDEPERAGDLGGAREQREDAFRHRAEQTSRVQLSEAEVEDIDLRKKGEAGQRAIETSSVEVERNEAATEAADESAPADEDAAEPGSDARPEPGDGDR